VGKLREVNELRWRSRGPRLPDTVLDAVTLKIQAALPPTYREYLAQMDGGRLANATFTCEGRTWTMEGIYPVAEATDRGAKLQKAGKLPEGIIPIAFLPDQNAAERKGPPVVFMDVADTGKVFIRTSPRARWGEEDHVFVIAKSFGAFLDGLGHPGGELKPQRKKKAAKKTAKKKAAKKKTAKKKTAKKKTAKKKTAKKKTAKKKTAKKTAKKKTAKKKAKKKTAKKAKKKTAKKAKKKTAKKKAKKKTAKKKAKKKTTRRR